MNKHVGSAIDPSWSDPDAAVTFLKALRPEGPWTVSAIYPDRATKRVSEDVGPVPTQTFADAAKLRAWIKLRSGAANLYFTANAVTPSSKKPSEADVAAVEFVHVDIDDDEHGPIAGDIDRKALVVEALRAYRRPGSPTFIIDSGGGVQALWRLYDDGTTPSEKRECRAINRQLVSVFGGDPGTFNLDRLLRLPGTVNLPDERKQKRGRVPLPATLVEANDQTYAMVEFESGPPLPEAKTVEIEIGDAVVVDDMDALAQKYNLPKRLVTIIQEGRLSKPKQADDSRSAWLFDAVCGLVRANVPNEVILGIITDARFAISESVLEKEHDRDEYAERQIRSAKAKLDAGFEETAVDIPLNGMEKHDNWPRLLSYTNGEHPTDAAKGRYFLHSRPGRLVTSDGIIFTLRLDGVWTEHKEAALRAEIRSTDPADKLNTHAVGGIVQAIEDLSYTSARPFEWIDPPREAPLAKNLVLFRNGVLNIETATLLPLDGSYFATALPNFDYEPDAQCPSWLTWIDERLDQSFHGTLQEWMGYVMVPDTTAHRFATFTGPPRSGKSTSKNIIEQLVGTDHISRKQLADMGKEFGLQDTIDKRLIVIPDAKDAPVSQRGQALERILAVTGGDITGVPRKYLPAVSVKLLTRLLVLGNRQPTWIDESGALAARQLAIVFDRSFEGKEDQNVEDELTAELPGIANWALEGLKRLRTNSYKFSVGEAGKAAVVEVRRSASPALRFAEECLEITGQPNDMVLVDKVYAAYRDWAEREGILHTRNKTDLMTDLTTSLHNVRQTQTRKLHTPHDWKGDEYRPRVLTGIKRVRWEVGMSP